MLPVPESFLRSFWSVREIIPGSFIFCSFISLLGFWLGFLGSIFSLLGCSLGLGCRFCSSRFRFRCCLGLGRLLLRCRSLGCRSEEHTSELQSLMRISYAVFCLKKKKNTKINTQRIKYPKYHKTSTK